MSNKAIEIELACIITIERIAADRFIVKERNGMERVVTLEIGETLTVNIPIHPSSLYGTTGGVGK